MFWLWFDNLSQLTTILYRAVVSRNTQYPPVEKAQLEMNRMSETAENHFSLPIFVRQTYYVSLDTVNISPSIPVSICSALLNSPMSHNFNMQLYYQKAYPPNVVHDLHITLLLFQSEHLMNGEHRTYIVSKHI